MSTPLREGHGTTTLIEPETRPSDGDDDDLFHYVRKDHIVESAVTGATVTALCGKTFPVTRSPKPGSPVCPACKEMLGMLRSFGGGSGDGSDGGGSGGGAGD